MHCSCVRQTDLPHTSRLFADYIYHPDHLSAFYRYPVADPPSYAAAARAADLPAEKRAALVSALRPINPNSANLEKLLQPGTVAVVTGQQVGLFSGPCYTVYKALTAVRLAAQLTENGIPAVPMFWLATEDHDFAEVNQAWVFDAAHQPVKLQLQRAANGQPVGEYVMVAPPVEPLRGALRGWPFADEVADVVAAAYHPGVSLGRAFGDLLARLLAAYDIVQVDPMLPAMRELAAPVLRRAVDAAPEITAALLKRNSDLADAGYHAQVHVEPGTSLVFLLEEGRRLALRRHNSDYVAAGRRLTADELRGRAAELSPNALLRPVVQDSMLPTAAYVGGPAELAYLAQSEVIYRLILDRMPVAVPRAGFTILDSHSEKLLQRYGLKLADFFHGEEALRERLAAKLVPPGIAAAVNHAAARIDADIERLRENLTSFDPTLAKALDRSASKMRYQISKMDRKVGREAMRRDARAAHDATSLYGLIYPDRHLQERLYSILPFLAKHGLDLIGHIHENIRLDCPDHRLLVI